MAHQRKADKQPVTKNKKSEERLEPWLIEKKLETLPSLRESQESPEE